MKAIGMIETRGLVPSIIAADTMLKAANVTLIKKENAGGGLITIVVDGDVGAVNAAVQAAVTQVEENIVSYHVIPRPSYAMDELLHKKEVKTPKDTQKKVEKVGEKAPVKEVKKEKSVVIQTVKTEQPVENEKIWTNEEIECLSVIELRKLARSLSDISLSREAIRDGKKVELVEEIINVMNRRRK